MFEIPDIVIVNYGRTQTYQIKCLRCGKLFLPNKLREQDLFCDPCLDVKNSKEEFRNYYKESNYSDYEYVGNIVGYKSKTPISKKRSYKNHDNVFKRDGRICQYCGYSPKNIDYATILSVDHIRSWDIGGDNSMENQVVSCMQCNSLLNAKAFTDFQTKKEYLLNLRRKRGLKIFWEESK
jgi:5-methylcytosine-specific restriction endonuclease McrA